MALITLIIRSFWGLLFIRSVVPHNFLTKSSLDSDGLSFGVLPPLEVVTLRNSSVYIPCSAGPTSTAKVSWTKENLPIQDSRIKVLENGTLFISRVTDELSGIFRCRITQRNYTIASAPVHLWIADINNFWDSVPPQNIMLAVGSVLRLSCLTVAKNGLAPPPGVHISWTKNYRDITPTDGIFMPIGGVLHIMDIMRQDAGSYRCKATFQHSDKYLLSPMSTVTVLESMSYNVSPLESEEKLFLRPSDSLLVLRTPMIVNVAEGSSALLECITNDLRNDPHGWVRFYNDEPNPMRRRGVEIVAQGSLFFHSVSAKDSGVYNCTTKHSSFINHETLSLVRLVVFRPPRVNFTESLTVANGLHPRFNCTAEGMPEPSIEILKNGLPLKNEYNYKLKRAETIKRNVVRQVLKINYAWRHDEAVYQCIAKNPAGVASEASKLFIERIHQIPPPTDVSVRAFTSTSILYEWRALNSFNRESDGQGYIVRFFLTAQKSKEQVLSSNITQKMYDNLMPDTHYTFIIHSFIIENSGTMNISDPIHVFQDTKADRPSRGPSVSLLLEQKNLQVTWIPLPLAEAGGKIVEQKIQWAVETNQSFAEVVLEPNVNAYSISGINPMAVYNVRVLAKSPAGYPLEATWTKIDMKKSSAKPNVNKDSSAPIHIELCLSSNDLSTILMKWNDHKKLETEQLNIRLIHTNGKIRVFVVGASKKQLLIHQLEAGCYKAFLSVKDSPRFESLKANASICTKVPTIYSPSIEYRLFSSQATSYTTDTISISWTPYRYQFFIIEINRVQYRPRSSFRPDNLEPYSILDKKALPPQPSDEELNDDNCRICRSPKGVIYNVVDASILIVTCLSANLTHLRPSTTYRIRVVAATFSHTGKPSTPLFVTTLEGVPSSPRDFSSEVLTTSTVNISWSPPEKLNGFLTKYEIVYSSDQNLWKTATISRLSTSLVLKGLVSNTYYQVKVAASTSVGRGEILEAVICIPAELRLGMSPEMIAVCVISMFVVITCVILGYLCLRMYRMRQAATHNVQRNNVPQMMYLSEEKENVEINESSQNHLSHHPLQNSDMSIKQLETKLTTPDERKLCSGADHKMYLMADEDSTLIKLLPSSNNTENDPVPHRNGPNTIGFQQLLTDSTN